jgi:hypothetical protein
VGAFARRGEGGAFRSEPRPVRGSDRLTRRRGMLEVATERAHASRALAFARGDAGPLPGMEQEPRAANARHDEVALGLLLAELYAVRSATLALLRHLPPEAWERSGVASGQRVTVRALAFIIAGHTSHHLAVLAERYGVTRCANETAHLPAAPHSAAPRPSRRSPQHPPMASGGVSIAPAQTLRGSRALKSGTGHEDHLATAPRRSRWRKAG